MRTHRIPALNMLLMVNGAFNFKRYSYSDFRLYGNARTLTTGQTVAPGWVLDEPLQVIPFYSPYESWRQKMVLNYSIDYITAELGIWVRFKAQQVILDKDLDKVDPAAAARGFYAAGTHYAIDEQASADLGLDRSYDELDLIVDNSRMQPKWLFSLTASKSLYEGAEISFFVENIFNDRAYYYSRNGTWVARSPQIFWGIGFSTILDNLF